jgi:hypothetical protein
MIGDRLGLKSLCDNGESLWVVASSHDISPQNDCGLMSLKLSNPVATKTLKPCFEARFFASLPLDFVPFLYEGTKVKKGHAYADGPAQ